MWLASINCTSLAWFEIVRGARLPKMQAADVRVAFKYEVSGVIESDDIC
jgi:hypothetical protein